MKLSVDLTKYDIQVAVSNYVAEKFGVRLIGEDRLKIEVKSKQNYRSVWEEAEYRGTFTVDSTGSPI